MSQTPDHAQAQEELLLRTAGASATEARTFGEMTRVENTVDHMHGPGFRLVDSPMHRLIFGGYDGLGEQFDGFGRFEMPVDVGEAIARCEAIVRQRSLEGRLAGPDGKLDEMMLRDLAAAGYFGLLVPREYGGLGATARMFTHCESRIAPWDYCTAILGSVHGAIGSVTPIVRFGTPEQKRRFLPLLARTWLSGFALTEKGAGSDTGACKLTGRRVGDRVVLGDGTSGKWFTTNLEVGSKTSFPRLISVVAKIDGRFEVVLFPVPAESSPEFKVIYYDGGLSALQMLHNNGSEFNGISVPADNILPTPEKTDGRVVALAALGFGRTSLAGLATGAQRGLLANVGRWAQHRVTMGKPIAERELVDVRVGKMAAMLVMSEALTSFAAHRYDLGYQIELEAQLAKVMTSEAVIVALEHFKNIHGGRSFSWQHRWSRFATELLAMNVYEGANDLLGPNIIRGLLKHFTEHDVGPVMAEAKRRELLREDGSFSWWALSPRHWPLLAPLGLKVAGLYAGVRGSAASVRIPGMHQRLERYVQEALRGIDRFRRELLWFFGTNRTTLTTRMMRMDQLSKQYQHLLSVVITCAWASEQVRPELVDAAEVWSQMALLHTGAKKEGQQFWNRAAALGINVIRNGFALTNGIDPDPIVFNYDN